MSVERLRDAEGASARRGLLALLGVVAVPVALVALVVLAPSGPPREAVADPEPLVTVVPPDDAREQRRERALGAQGSAWAATLAGLGLTPAGEPAAELVVDSGTGKPIGVVWHARVPLGEEWSVDVEVMQRAPAVFADPCRPERWGMAGARVLDCLVEEPDGPGGRRLAVAATSSPAGAPTGEDQAGWTRVADVREGDQHVQLLLTRVAPGTQAPPLSPSELLAIARDRAWYER